MLYRNLINFLIFSILIILFVTQNNKSPNKKCENGGHGLVIMVGCEIKRNLKSLSGGHEAMESFYLDMFFFWMRIYFNESLIFIISIYFEFTVSKDAFKSLLKGNQSGAFDMSIVWRWVLCIVILEIQYYWNYSIQTTIIEQIN